MTGSDGSPARAAGTRGPYAKSEGVRRAILDAALEVFAQSGYRGGALRAVADRVGMSEAGLLHHFPSKGALLVAVLEHRDAESQRFVPPDDEDGPESLRWLVRLAGYNASTPGVVELYCMLSAEATSPDHPAHAYFVGRYESARSRLTATFERLAAAGALNPGVDAGSAARTTIALMDGLQIQWLLDRDSVDMAEELRGHLNRLIVADL
ncbi:TetR/AcrR family transcriptional regulator [Jiangella anatolica]|uniref:TetR/AcrR family transcriptional regulator n=1 Tax=Jiangella anatolica TaxID=2670374 RepID=A0A2W2CDU3_9ACTN|nr:TetR/AcrR family transcriptional regulator [Jiangella anatolica]PZF83826.1 TetR/AcrR family transcriptional regulator [Jiangella anatolica]